MFPRWPSRLSCVFLHDQILVASLLLLVRHLLLVAMHLLLVASLLLLVRHLLLVAMHLLLVASLLLLVRHLLLVAMHLLLVASLLHPLLFRAELRTNMMFMDPVGSDTETAEIKLLGHAAVWISKSGRFLHT